MGGRASAGEGILFYVAIAPNILLAKIQEMCIRDSPKTWFAAAGAHGGSP